MNFPVNLKSLKNSNNKWLFLILLVILLSTLTYYRVKLQMDLGPILDTYDFLADAAEFAGMGIDYTDLNRPPLLSLLTAIIFRFEGLSVGAIFIVDGILYILGCIGLYLFLKSRFDSLTSFVGSLLFATFPIVVTFAGAGFNDVSSVAFSIWAIYLTFLAVEKDSRFFYLSFPVAMLAFLTRYNMALLIFPIILYILIRRSEIKKPKNLYIGILFGALILIPLFIFFNAKFGNPIYPFLDFFKTSTAGGTTEHFAYNTNPFFFIENLPSYVGIQFFMVIGFSLLACFAYLLRKKEYYIPILKSWTGHLNETKTQIKLLISLILLFLFVITFGMFNYMISEVIFFVFCYVLYEVSKDLKISFNMDLLFISWFMTFFIFQSIYVAKDHRYFICMAAPFAYFLIRGFHFTTQELKVQFKNKNLSLYLLSILLIIIMLFSAFSQLPDIEKTNQNSKLFNQETIEASNWIKTNDPAYKSKVIYADLWSYYGWHLQTNIGKMPIFRNNQTLYMGVKDYNFTLEDNMALDRELEILRPDYYISAWKPMTFTSYMPIQRFGGVTIYVRRNT